MNVKMKNISYGFGLFTCMALLCSCAERNPNVALNADFWNTKSRKPITVSLAQEPKPSLNQFGSEGVLDYSINTMMTSTFSNYLKNYNLAAFNVIQSDFVENFQKNNIAAVMSPIRIDSEKLPKSVDQDTKQYAEKDYRSLAIKVEGDRLLVIDILNVGADRSYYGFIPLGAPQAFCSAEGQLINLKNNKILWRFSTVQEVSVSGRWDQPPNYENFSIALNQVLNQTKTALLTNFFYSAPNVP